jgi:hypothetical protein
VVDSPALNLMAVMNEHSLYDSWIPLLKVSSLLSLSLSLSSTAVAIV